MISMIRSIASAMPIAALLLSLSLFSLFSLACDALQTRSLRRASIAIDGNPLKVEIAATPEDRERGLMYRRELGVNEGMLFVFPYSRPVAFWMKNTFIPLDVGYFSSEKRLIEVFSMEPDNGQKTYPSTSPVLYAVETRLGWYKKRGLKKDAPLELPFRIEAF